MTSISPRKPAAPQERRFQGPDRPVPPRRLKLALGVVLLFMAVLASLVILKRIEPIVAGLYLALSLITFALYGWDKSAARRGRWRTPEARLQVLALAGGWPGALLAQHWFRHKTRKQPFQAIFWGAVLLNGAGLAWLVVSGMELTDLQPALAAWLEAILKR